jgi:hypothetical protein
MPPTMLSIAHRDGPIGPDWLKGSALTTTFVTRTRMMCPVAFGANRRYRLLS